MNLQIIIVLILNFIIALIGTLAYSVRLVGVRTGKIAVSFAVFNILSLISRTAVTFQVPILTKFVENSSSSEGILSVFYMTIIVSTIATIVGAFLIPTFQRIFYKAVINFSIEKSITKLIMHSFTKSGVKFIRDCVKVPVNINIFKINYRKLPINIIIYNLIAVAFITVGGIAPIYAGSMIPELRATCITLSSLINGTATVLMSIFIDPSLSIMTDDVIEGKCTEEDFRSCVAAMVGSKAIGTFLSLILVIPASNLIVLIAKII